MRAEGECGGVAEVWGQAVGGGEAEHRAAGLRALGTSEVWGMGHGAEGGGPAAGRTAGARGGYVLGVYPALLPAWARRVPRSSSKAVFP